MAKSSNEAALTPEEFQRATNVSRETMDRLEAHAALLRKWTGAINLVSKASLADLWRRHMLDSAQLLHLLPPPPASGTRTILDIGSGAGFPGLVLAIMGAGHVYLVEADAKKAAFLREAARLTSADVTLRMERIEQMLPFAVDVVTARACAPLPTLLDYAMPFLRSTDGALGGVGLFLKGRESDRELTDLPETWDIEVDAIPSCTDSKAKIVRIRAPSIGGDQL